jgi:phytoene dehydrogenase-like protein
MGQFAFPRGGMGSIAEAMASRARAKGAEVRVDAPVRRIVVEKGRAAGVVLENGDELRAPTVLSNADPRRTFLSLVDAQDLPSDYVSRLRRYDARGSMARVFLALDKLPDFVGLPKGEGPQHRGLTLLGADVEGFQRVADAQQYGRVPDDFPIEFIIQSVHDDTMTPAGKHLLSTGIQQLPFELESGTWDDYKSTFTKNVIDVMESYAPGIKDSIIDTATITPLDLEREYALPGGNIFHGAMTMGQLYSSRPISGYGSYRSPVPGLYLCGSGTHPGGGVMGAPGHNAAHAVLADEAGGGWRGEVRLESSFAAKTTLAQRMMANPSVRRVALPLARQPAFSKIVDWFSRR